MTNIETFLQDPTFPNGLRALKESGGAIAKIIPKDKKGRPLSAMVIVRGRTETKEILAAIEAVEKKWSAP